MNRLLLAASIATIIAAGCATATPTTTPAPTQSASELQTADELEPGRYYVDFDGYRYAFSVAGEGWRADTSYGAVFQGEDPELAIFWPSFGNISSLYRDPCESAGTEFEPGPSVDELADALVSLEGFEATAPTDVTVSNFNGKRVAITVPMDADVRSPACDEGEYSLSAERWFQAPGQTDDMLILDLGGARQVITSSTTPATPSDVAGQLRDMVESLVIEPTPSATVS